MANIMMQLAVRVNDLSLIYSLCRFLCLSVLLCAHMPNVTQAIRQMRKKSGLNQQFFATAVNMSTRALAQYEDGIRSPEPKQMLAFYAYASEHHPELAAIFWEAFVALVEPLAGVTLTTTERVLDLIKIAIYRLSAMTHVLDRDSVLAAISQMLAAAPTAEEVNQMRQTYGIK
jgi:DNA-binding XRE family transcriptional regulator